MLRNTTGERIPPVLKILFDNTQNYIQDTNFEVEFNSIHLSLFLSRPCVRGRVVFQLLSVTFLYTTPPTPKLNPI
jgi:hypothetical protein